MLPVATCARAAPDRAATNANAAKQRVIGPPTTLTQAHKHYCSDRHGNCRGITGAQFQQETCQSVRTIALLSLLIRFRRGLISRISDPVCWIRLRNEDLARCYV